MESAMWLDIYQVPTVYSHWQYQILKSKKKWFNFHWTILIISILRQYQLPDCKISLKLFNDHSTEHIGSTVQVFGEVRLYDPEQEITYNTLESSYSLKHKLIEFKSKLEQESDDIGHIKKRFEEEVEKIKSTFLPIIQVHNVKAVTDAREIIVENLNFRLLQKKRDEIFPHVP